MVAGLGSPNSAPNMSIFGPVIATALNGMTLELAKVNRTIQYIYSGEQGGLNTMVAIYAAINSPNQLPLLDTDANGRAIPALYTTLAAIQHVSMAPSILADFSGNYMAVWPNIPEDAARTVENIARHMSEAYNDAIGFSTWPMTGVQISEGTVVGQIRTDQAVGHVINDSAATIDDVIATISAQGYTIEEICRGQITNISVQTINSFDVGVTEITASGEVYKVFFQNENLYVIKNSDTTATVTVPDIIALLDESTKMPLSNSDTEINQNVRLFGIRVNELWHDNPTPGYGYAVWQDILVGAGYSTVGPQAEVN
jgi:DUF917 family protein